MVVVDIDWDCKAVAAVVAILGVAKTERMVDSHHGAQDHS